MKIFVVLHETINITDFVRSTVLKCKRPYSTDSQKHRERGKWTERLRLCKKGNCSNSQNEKEKKFHRQRCKTLFGPHEKVILAMVGSNVRFHIQNLVLGEGKRIGCLTLIHNVLRCVKLLPCQKITALHTATHALVIKGGPCWTQALSISRRDVCECLWRGGAGCQAGAPFSASDKQSITNYFLCKVYDSRSLKPKCSGSWYSFLFMCLLFSACTLSQPAKHHL